MAIFGKTSENMNQKERDCTNDTGNTPIAVNFPLSPIIKPPRSASRQTPAPSAASTPATVALTPDDIPKQLVIPVSTSNAHNNDSSTCSSTPSYETTSSSTAMHHHRHGRRDPSPQQGGRTLFEEEYEYMSDYDHEVLRKLPSAKDPFGNRYRSVEPVTTNSRKLRSRRSVPNRSFLLLESSDDDESGGADSRGSMIRHRRRQSSADDKRACYAKLPSNSCLIWILCLVGLTSISMSMVMNHTIDRQDDPEVAILFRNGSVRRVVGPAGLVNLKHLAQSHDKKTKQKPERRDDSNEHAHDAHRKYKKLDKHKTTSTATQNKEKEKTNEKKHHSEKEKHHHHHHHHGDKKTKHLSTQVGLGDKKAHADAHEKHHSYHHHHHEEIAREIIRAKPAIERMNDIPPVSIPKPIQHPRVPGFDIVDRNLYNAPKLKPSLYRRISMMDGSSLETAKLPLHREIAQYPAVFTDNTQYYSILDSGDERVGNSMEIREPYSDGECEPMQDWQTTFHPSCNGMHELDLAGMGDRREEDDFNLFGMNGFWRNAWRYDSGHGTVGGRDTVVLKTLRINHRFEDAHFEHNRIDAVVLERLTASPHVINVFGFCGHSVLTEYADGKRLGELADKKRKESLSRLAIAIDIASGLADVHGIDGDGNATFVHLDINPANVVSIGGTLKLNDFNIGVLRRWNTTSNQPCGIPAQYPNPQWRSPEEARNEQNLTEKVDVFSLGHILFRLICGHEPWHKLEPGGMPPKDVMTERVKKGILPTVPEDVQRSNDPEVVAIRKAMMRCYTYDPNQRPSAREISESLKSALRKLQQKAAVA